MFRTAVLHSKKRAMALSVHFKQPELGMKDYEILSRASCFLLSVDPPIDQPQGKYAHLDEARDERESKLKKQDYAYDPAGGPKRKVQDLNWLEFVPSHFRPLVHCVAASHVLAPWRWKDYYPHDWLQSVTQEHCVYSLEVYDPEKTEPLAKFALNPYVIHHPNDMDLAIIHLKQEESTLRHLKDLGVEVMHLRNDDNNFEEGENVVFEGFEIADDAPITDFASIDVKSKKEKTEDTRVFMPYTVPGTLFVATTERLLATTDVPLPEGLCGGPTIDKDGTVCGIVEGIIPKTHDDERLAGAASFIPSFRIQQFLDHAERLMLESIMPPEIFRKVVELKNTGEMGNENLNPDDAADEYEHYIQQLRQKYSKQEVDAILGTIRREREEVVDIMDRQGGELQDVVGRVREKTVKTREELMKKYSTPEAEYEEKSDSGSDGTSKKGS
jgi:hypothetical protein